MPIKDRDGNVYKLRGPNPVMTSQADWDKSKMKLFNLGYKSEIVVDERSPVREMAESVINIRDELGLVDNEASTKVVPARQFIAEIQEEVAVAEPEPEVSPDPIREEPQPVVLNVDKRLARIIKERGAQYHCAPAVGHKVHTDELYGNSYRTTKFGDKFVFDAVVIDQSDFQLQFWCIKPVTKDSVIYKKDPEGGERWWKVEEIEPKSGGGYLVVAGISLLNPDFS